MTISDDLMVTHASDNEVYTISVRKVDKEEHCADVLADELFRFSLVVWIRRYGEKIFSSVKKRYLTHFCSSEVRKP